MNRRFRYRSLTFVCGILILLVFPGHLIAEPAAAAIATFNAYNGTVELRLAERHRSAGTFLAPIAAESDARLRRGELTIQQIAPSAADPTGATIYDWRGTAFAPGANAADFERLMRDFPAYPQLFAPQVLQARIVAQNSDHFSVTMRIRQKHVITVVMDTTYDVTFGRLDAQHGYSVSRSTQISEIASPGTAYEHALSPTEEHGFLWRLNTYWTYEQRDGGLYMQIESVSLTRSIPRGLGWVVQPFVQSVPRESLEFTLRATCNALEKRQPQERTQP